MKLPFLDRDEETARLVRLVARAEGSLAVLYGRRRCGKSRLLRETLPVSRTVYYVGDDRESALQRAGLAAEIARLLPEFDSVVYPGWDDLLARFWQEASAGTVLALDEFPALVAVARELPSLLQKYLDRFSDRGLHVVVTGSSQRMMQGLVLDRTAPLFGRATEVLKIAPLPAGWIVDALRLRDAVRAVEAYAVWGGTPRYWELAAEHPDLETATRTLVLSPLGVLFDEPTRLLLDDLRDTSQAASILSLIGGGCHRASELAGRLGKPATSLSRPLQRLQEMGLVRREMPFGTSPRSSKRTLYRIADPFLRYWYRFVARDRSRLGAGQLDLVARDIARDFAHHVGEIWEELARASVPQIELFGDRWGPARRWWGTGLDRKPLEIDLVAENARGNRLLLGEAKWATEGDAKSLLERLQGKAERLPFAAGREVRSMLWLRQAEGKGEHERVVTPDRVLGALR